MKKVSGFTIVELVVVIIILGILAATALPRFIDVSSDAHRASVDAVQGGLESGIAMVQAKWMASGKPTAGVSMADGSTIFTNTSGYASVGDAVIDAAECDDLFIALLQNAPAIQAAVVANEAGAVTAYNADTTVDWYHLDGGTGDCTFFYAASGVTSSLPTIVYDHSAGTITRSN